ncbi:ABC transporter ATP-binding protein [Pararobbsia alpina]|uniref:High-affinity branched-chain amino acid transport ATP-binding protein LivF n=1 Tax=Pararobbsia alpina TaxID=621374 RepID=A0A6S7D2S1_9BURK|nr:ABC transporter ATP-binding protein [Pararobbsia alpina]CAB3794550.1 High-affinity branched-chain amino acid transport ATP-binding protein LivF [Pararobbsia alpina]
MLELRDIHAGYGLSTVLRGIDLRVGAGERVAILGRNGVGKTTLLRAIVGAIRLQQGELMFDGRTIGELPTHERARLGIAYVPQGREIFPSLSVLDNLKAAAFGTGQLDWKARVDELFIEFPVLAEKQKARGASLSGGQQQILALARALITQPRLLILDEPTEGIQPSIVDQIADTIRAINEKRGIAVIVVEQNLDFVVRLGTHAHIIEKGAIVADMPAADLLHDEVQQRKYLGV